MAPDPPASPAAPQSPGPAPRLGALRSVPFRFLLGAGMSMQLAQWVRRIALSWIVWELTGSAAHLAGLGFLESIFVLFISPLTGPIAMRFQAKRVLMFAALLQAGAASVLAWAIFTDNASLALLYAVTVLYGVAQSLNMPMRNLLVYDAVGRDLLRNGIALNSLTGNLMRIVGPSVGGIVLAAWGGDAAFALQATLSLLAVGLVAMLSVEPTRAVSRASVFADLAAGVAHLRENTAALTNVAMALLASTLIYPYVQFMPVFVERMGGEELEFGFINSAIAVGSLVGTVWVASGRGGMRTMLWAATGYMWLVFAFTQVEAFWLGFAVLSVAGVAHAVFSTLNQTLVQLNAGEEYRARVVGLYAMSGGLEPFSMLALGALVSAFGVNVAVGGFVALAASAALVLALLSLRGRFDASPAPAAVAEAS